ncbi:methyltransferase [Streptomyces platensis]|uniref:methyltransferase n=1 Tax=Streptomyces platensis TaxID=58346 RepID=UPI003F4CE709
MSETGIPLEPRAANQELRRRIMGYIVSQSIFTVNELRIADRLDGGPRHVADLAHECNVDADALQRTLRALAAEGLFREGPAGTFCLAALGELLRTDAPGSLHEFVNLMAGESYRVWADSAYSVRTGRPAFDLVHGRPHFNWLAEHADAARNFNRAQASLVTHRLLPLLGRNWSDVKTVVDIGGGDGTLLARLLGQEPHLEGVLFDLPHVVTEAEMNLAESGVRNRTRIVGGDFFAEVPAGGDVYVLAQILHDWNEEKALGILRSCRQALPAHGRLLILEQVIPEGNEPHPAKLLDLHMLVLLGGRERTETDWRSLLTDSGFRLDSVEHGGRSSLMTAVLD